MARVTNYTPSEPATPTPPQLATVNTSTRVLVLTDKTVDIVATATLEEAFTKACGLHTANQVTFYSTKQESFIRNTGVTVSDVTEFLDQVTTPGGLFPVSTLAQMLPVEFLTPLAQEGVAIGGGAKVTTGNYIYQANTNQTMDYLSRYIGALSLNVIEGVGVLVSRPMIVVVGPKVAINHPAFVTIKGSIKLSTHDEEKIKEYFLE